MDADRRRDVGLFRYSLVREVASMSPRRRGLAVRELAGREHLTPWGERVRVSRVTLDRWVRAWRQGGFEALVPAARDGVPRTPVGLLDLAVALKREAPERTAAQIVRIILEREGSGPAERTIQRHFVRVGLNVRPSGQTAALGRFEAERPNELWIGDALHGPLVAARKAILFCFIDDHSRLLPGYRWGTREDVLRLARCAAAWSRVESRTGSMSTQLPPQACGATGRDPAPVVGSGGRAGRGSGACVAGRWAARNPGWGSGRHRRVARDRHAGDFSSSAGALVGVSGGID
jgi:putative transposase